MVRSGRVDMKEISVYLGHRSVVVTERVYAKFKPTFMIESSSVMADAINFWDRNVIMWHKQVFFSCKTLMLGDKLWYALGDYYSMISITYKRLVPVLSVTVGQKGYLIIDKASFWTSSFLRDQPLPKTENLESDS